MASDSKKIAEELPFIRVYKDGTVERLGGSPIVPPCPKDSETGVSSKDITISFNPNISARLYLPNLPQNHTKKLPILVYFHGGAFCLESAFSFAHHRYLNQLVSESKVVAVSVEYRLAPENPLPAAYEDCWVALQWVTSHSICQEIEGKEPWLINYGDFKRLYIGGDSAGANIVHNIAIKSGIERLPTSVKILGIFLAHPYFWGSVPIGSEPIEGFEKSLPSLVWRFVYPEADCGRDNPMINPKAEGGPSLAVIGCSRILVCVAGKDELRERGVWYFNAVRESGWKGEIQLFEVEEEDHAFHVFNFGSENAKAMIKRLAYFIV